MPDPESEAAITVLACVECGAVVGILGKFALGCTYHPTADYKPGDRYVRQLEDSPMSDTATDPEDRMATDETAGACVRHQHVHDPDCEDCQAAAAFKRGDPLCARSAPGASMTTKWRWLPNGPF
jgi:hypothetical protein